MLQKQIKTSEIMPENRRKTCKFVFLSNNYLNNKNNMVSGTIVLNKNVIILIIVLVSIINYCTCTELTIINNNHNNTNLNIVTRNDQDATIGIGKNQTESNESSTQPMTISSFDEHFQPDRIKIIKKNNYSKDQFYQSEYYSNETTGNELWDGLIKECLRKPTFSCLQKNVHNYLDTTLNSEDINVTDTFVFRKNQVDYYKYTRVANTPLNNNNHLSDDQEIERENEIPDEEARSASPIEEVTDSLYNQGLKFMMTHDIEFQLPEILFDGAAVKISPRSFEGSGALVKLDIIPKAVKIKETGRILFKKIKKFFANKLLLSFLAIVLIIKLIKIKLIWFLPFLIGATAAKKLLLKFLLFLFPALSHIFKLCSYYHNNYHQTKYHHHQHHINHHHTVLPPWFNEQPHHHNDYHGPELIFTKPPKGHPSDYIHSAPPPAHLLIHHNNDWDSSGPGFGEFDTHRNSHVQPFKPKYDDSNEIDSWGLGGGIDNSVSGSATAPPIYTKNINPLIQEGTSRVNIQRLSPVYNRKNSNPVYNSEINSQIQQPQSAAETAAQYNSVADQQRLKDAQRLQAQQLEAIRIQAEQRIIAQQQKILQQQPFVQEPQTLQPKMIDPYYSPILIKIDKIFLQLGFPDEPCRERLVCSMYKHPTKFSPHSNFISAELSRDSNDLDKPASVNSAYVRFYRYVQAARDGQDGRDCFKLYPQCSINTES